MGTVIQPGGWAQGSLGMIGVVFKLWGHDTGGALSMVERYGLRFGRPDWLPELIARYHLTPPPGS